MPDTLEDTLKGLVATVGDLATKVDNLDQKVKKLEAKRSPKAGGLPAKGLTDEHQKILDQIKEQEGLLEAVGTSDEEKARIKARLKQLRELEADLREAL